MKLFLFILPWFVTLSSVGQIVIQGEDMILDNSRQYILHTVIPAPEFTERHNSIWDFSDLKIGYSQAVNMGPADLCPIHSRFPNATSCYSLGKADFLFANITTEGYWKHGGIAKGVMLKMDDPELYFDFPLTVGKQWTDSLTSEFSTNGIGFVRKGKVTGSVISEGNLMMPYGSMSNVLRVEIIEELTDNYSVLGTPLTSKTTNVIQCIIKKGNAEPLITITETFSNKELISSFATYLDASSVKFKDSDGPWNSPEVIKDENKSELTIEFVSEWEGLVAIEQLNLNGQPLRAEKGRLLTAGPNRLSISPLPDTRYLSLIVEESQIILPIPQD